MVKFFLSCVRQACLNYWGMSKQCKRKHKSPCFTKSDLQLGLVLVFWSTSDSRDLRLFVTEKDRMPVHNNFVCGQTFHGTDIARSLYNEPTAFDNSCLRIMGTKVLDLIWVVWLCYLLLNESLSLSCVALASSFCMTVIYRLIEALTCWTESKTAFMCKKDPVDRPDCVNFVAKNH